MKPKPYEIVYEDERLIAVNKASGIAVTADRWDPAAPRLDRLLEAELPQTDGSAERRFFTVHRIDRETSGLVIFARDRESHRLLSADFEGRRVEKIYTAVVHGRPAWPEGKALCDLPLLPEGNKKHLTIIDRYRGKPSRTWFTLCFSSGNYSVVEARPETGRTHQIRVHLSALGHPVVCDSLYGKHARSGTEAGVYLSSFKRNWRGETAEERPLLARLGLHAAVLIVPARPSPLPAGDRPDAGPLELQAPLPRDMAALLRQMKKRAGLCL